MSLSTNITELQAILESVNSLPEGGEVVQTRTASIVTNGTVKMTQECEVGKCATFQWDDELDVMSEALYVDGSLARDLYPVAYNLYVLRTNDGKTSLSWIGPNVNCLDSRLCGVKFLMPAGNVELRLSLDD